MHSLSLLACSPLSGRPVYLVAATLRPETMYGQTNCWVRPDMKYVAFPTAKGEVFLCSKRAARNMAFQGFTQEFGKFQVLLSLVGQVCLCVCVCWEYVMREVCVCVC